MTVFGLLSTRPSQMWWGRVLETGGKEAQVEVRRGRFKGTGSGNWAQCLGHSRVILLHMVLLHRGRDTILELHLSSTCLFPPQPHPQLEEKMSEFSTRGQRVEAFIGCTQMLGKLLLFVMVLLHMALPFAQTKNGPVTSEKTLRRSLSNSHFCCLTPREFLTHQSWGPRCLDYFVWLLILLPELYFV